MEKSGNSNCTATQSWAHFRIPFHYLRCSLRFSLSLSLSLWQRFMFSIGQEMVREKYHFAKSWKSQGILTVPRHKDKSTFEFIFPLVQAWLKVPCWQRLVFCRILYRCSVLYRCWILYRCSHHRPWCEWCDIWRRTTPPGSTSPTLFRPMVWVFITFHKNQISVSALRRDLMFFVLIRED